MYGRREANQAKDSFLDLGVDEHIVVEDFGVVG
jgi:hypothetical protein